MALLNYAKTLKEVESYIGMLEASSGDYVKLIFTQDGHIITHGVDLLADYLAGKRGMVPTYDSNAGDYGVLGKSGWEKLTTNHLPIAASNTPAADTLFTSQQVSEYVAREIGAGFAANDAMVFKGGITKLADITLPYSAGYTYRATESFEFNDGKLTRTVKPGDVVIAITDSDTLSGEHFIVVEANILGTSEVKINGKKYNIYTQEIQDAYQFYAPTGPGVAGQVLVSTGSNEIPEWVNQTSINAGQLQGKALDELIEGVTANNGTISVIVGGTTKSATASGNWNITAAQVAHDLQLGTGLAFTTGTSYNGSEARVINLVAATTSTLGGVTVGANISVTDGKISITKQNVIDALEFDPQQGIGQLTVVTTEKEGFAPKIVTTEGHLTNGYRVLAYNGNDTSWYTLPETAFIDTTYDPATTEKDGLMSATDKAKLNGIAAGAEVNQNAFSTIVAGNTITASSATDTVTFANTTTVTVASDIATKTISFSVPTMVGATASKDGVAGLVTAPTTADTNKFLKGDGTWSTPIDTNTWRKILVGEVELGNGIDTGDLRIQGAGSTKVGLADNVLTIESTDTVYTGSGGISVVGKVISLNAASASNLGGIKLGFTETETDKKYAVKIDSENKAYVEVPWTDTKRDIQVNGTSIDNLTLNIKPSGEIYIIEDTTTDNVYNLSFGLSWYNMSANDGAGAYEYAN